MTRREKIIEMLEDFEQHYILTKNDFVDELFVEQQAWLREELIKYDKWCETISMDYVSLSNEKLVDAYLKQKK